MIKKLEFKDKNQRRKCWVYTIILSCIFTVFFIAIGILGIKEYDFFGISIISILVIWEFYRVFKFYLVTEFKNQTEKNRCWVYSLIAGVVIAVIIVSLGRISQLKFFDIPTSIQTLILIPLIFFKNLSNWVRSFLLKPIEIKKSKFRTWCYAGLFSVCIAGALTGTAPISKDRLHPIFIFFIWLASFMGFSERFDVEKGKKITKGIKFVIFVLASLTLILWYVILKSKI